MTSSTENGLGILSQGMGRVPTALNQVVLGLRGSIGVLLLLGVLVTKGFPLDSPRF